MSIKSKKIHNGERVLIYYPGPNLEKMAAIRAARKSLEDSLSLSFSDTLTIQWQPNNQKASDT